MSQLQYRNENQNFISNFVFKFIKKMKWHLRYTDFYFEKRKIKFNDQAIQKIIKLN